MKPHSPGGKREDPVVAPLLATGSDPKKRERGCGKVVQGCVGGVCLCRGCLCRGAKDGENCFSRCCFSGGCMMQIYVDDDRDKVGVVDKGEHVEVIDTVDFDFVFDFPHALNFSHSFDFFDFSDFLIFRCLRQSAEVLTLYKKKADKVRPVSRPHEGGLRPGGKGNWHLEAISKECYKPGGAYGG